MNITIDHTLIERLIDCINHQAALPQQDEATQKHWQTVIDNTVRDAARFLPLRPNLHVSDRREVGEGAYISPDKSSFV